MRNESEIEEMQGAGRDANEHSKGKKKDEISTAKCYTNIPPTRRTVEDNTRNKAYNGYVVSPSAHEAAKPRRTDISTPKETTIQRFMNIT